MTAGPVRSRSMWALVAQGLSSGSNVVVSIVILATATRAEFAIFSICLMSYLLAAQLSRSLLSLPVLILYSGSEVMPRPARSVAGLAVVMGAAVAVPLGATALTLSDGRGQFVALALLMPLLLYQDVVRHIAFARGDPKAAALSDGLWLTLLLGGSAVAVGIGYASPTVLLALWGVSGGISACVFGAALGALPRFEGMATWVGEHRKLWAGLAVEFLLISGSSYLVYYGLSILAGSDQLGRIRAAQTFIGPVTVALLGGAALGVPESVRLRHDARRLHRFAVVLSCGLAAGALLFGALAYLLLPIFGPELFAQTWAGARPVVPVLTLFATALAVTIGAVSPLRAMGQVPWIVRTRALTGALALAIGLPASAGLGANGAVGALAVTEALFATLAWLHLRRHLATGRTSGTEAGVPAGETDRWLPEI